METHPPNAVAIAVALAVFDPRSEDPIEVAHRIVDELRPHLSTAHVKVVVGGAAKLASRKRIPRLRVIGGGRS